MLIFLKKLILLILVFLIISSYFYVTPQKVFAQNLPVCPNPQVQVDVLDRSKRTSPSMDMKTLLSDDVKARFTVDVKRTANSGPPTNAKDWQMQWQCGINTPTINVSSPLDPNLAGTDNIYTDIENSGSLNNRCEYDPKNNPIRIKVTASINNTRQDFCEASYYVVDADKLCKLDLNSTAGVIQDGDPIILGQPLSVSGDDLTKDGSFVLKFDQQPIWTDKKTLELPTTYFGIGPKLGIDLNRDLANVSTPTFSGRSIEAKYLTQGQHEVSLHRVTRNLGNSVPLLSRSVNDSIESESLCSIAFTIGTSSNPGKILSRKGGVVTTEPKSAPCSGPTCTTGGGSACKNSAGVDIPDTVQTAIGCIHTNPVGLVKDVLKFVIAISGGIALLLMIIGAFGMITSAGNPDNLASSRDRFVKAIEGLLFIIFAVLLLRIIGVDILGLGAFLGVGP